MRHARWIFIAALIAAAGLSGCNESKESQVAQNSASKPSNTMKLPVGTSIEVTLGTSLSSETASVGTAWSGTALTGREGIPAGSPVDGTVTSVKAAKKGDRAMLGLGLNSITIAGQRFSVHGSTEAIIAGSTRARNLGAIAGSAAAGAIVGNAVSGSTKGTVIGAVVGGGAATAVVAASDGYQVALKPGILLTFTINQTVAVRE
jgi:hypothetical protein